MPLSAGDKLGPYEILAPIGSAGMDRTVAIKVLPADKTGDDARRERFLQKAKAASSLSHPNIITIYDIGSENGIDYIAMEYIAGKTLDPLILRNGMRLSEMLRFATQASDALSKAHQAGIIHRDLKPSNMIVSPDGVIKVLDFGLAKLTAMATKEGDATQTMKALTKKTAKPGSVNVSTMAPRAI